jgi:hypothetical protein
MTSFRNMFGKSSSLIAIGSCLFVLPAHAEVTTTTTVTTTGDIVNSSGQIVGHVVKETTIKSDVYLETIDSRYFELEKVIAEGMATGKITQTQADYLRSELDYVTKQEQIIKKVTGITPYEQIAVLAVRLDVVGQRLSDLVGYKWVPIVTNGRFVVLSGEVVQLGEMAMRRAKLEGKISLALANSTLTTGQADTIRGQLDSIASTEVQFRSSSPSSEFTNEQAKKLFTDFDHVASNLETDISKNHGNPITTEPKK